MGQNLSRRAQLLELRKKLLQEHEEYKNIMMVPNIEKVVVSMGIAKAIQDRNNIEILKQYMLLGTGQYPVECYAKRSIANFKTRKGNSLLGLKVTLRGEIMWEFIFTLIHIAAPNIRNFVGFKDSFSNGNFSIGVPDWRIFPSIDPNATLMQGANITFVTSPVTNDEGCRRLLDAILFPFIKRRGQHVV